MLTDTVLLLQTPPLENPLQGWLDVMTLVLNIGYALATRGYLLLILVGFALYVTGVSDVLAKVIVGAGIFIYFFGPFVIGQVVGFVGVEPVTSETARLIWQSVMGMPDVDLVYMVLVVSDLVASVCVLAGAILYFTPSTNDLRSRGQSLIVRSLMFAPVLAYLHIFPW
ncbi:MAG: hypothetical protein HXY34_09850 [Candidatus Thorarchaeota archaeon]|nr:hypothetical protein [Candidatus Thorarchaeota archaeon]